LLNSLFFNFIRIFLNILETVFIDSKECEHIRVRYDSFKNVTIDEKAMLYPER